MKANLTRFLNYLAGTVLLFAAVAREARAQELYPVQLPQQAWHNEQRELRYRPEGKDFVIINGNRLFTRALYGTNTAFRVETGDRPEFALYMPGMGGNFKLGIQVKDQSIWLKNAAKITARYRAGSMIYQVKDPLLGSGQLTIQVLAMSDAEGIVIKTSASGLSAPVSLIWAFGGATGKKFSRDGDMGPDPESSFYLKAENCKDNSFAIEKNTFILTYGAGIQVGQDGRYFTEDLQQAPVTSKSQLLSGVFPPGSVLKLSDATKQDSPASLYASDVEKAPLITGRLLLKNAVDNYFTVHNPATKPAFGYAEAQKVFMSAEKARQALAGRIRVETPDPYLNTIGGALAMAADAIWEAPSYLHGSVGWRMRLNGWRGPYTGDELGWHDRAKTHFEAYAKSQVTSPPSGPVLADTAQHLSRSTEKLGLGMFTSGYISRDPEGKNLRAHHYDMNLVYIDELLWHFRWTGDLAFIKETWPVIKRHLEWEKRNFDPDGDGLYDAYAAIWASDALQYSGGAVTHSSAYNYIANKKAAELALLVGEDPAPFREQAQKILTAMNKVLWMPEKGVYAEFKDALGNRLLHQSPALWTIYHSVDSEVPDPFQAYQSVRYVDNYIPHIPVRASGLQDDDYYTLATSTWMPYTWSLNNVALAESMHTALANWQAGRTNEAFKLFKSEVLASMYLGGSPGNIVQISHYDAVRGEAYRDFGDPIGMFSRALVEGLFGIVPDALSKTLTVRPGLPSSWKFASFSTPDIAFDFKRLDKTDTYVIIPSLPVKLGLRFRAIAQGQVSSVTVNGKAVKWRNIGTSVGQPVIGIDVSPAVKYTISIRWTGIPPSAPSEKTVVTGGLLSMQLKGATADSLFDPQHSLEGFKPGSALFSARAAGAPGKYTSFVKVRQGALSWWMPVCFTVTEPASILLSKGAGNDSQSFRVKNNTDKAVQASVKLNSYAFEPFEIAPGGVSRKLEPPQQALITGTSTITLGLNGKNSPAGTLVNWSAAAAGKQETVNLSSYFNDKVTQIFKNKYLTPRPQVTTLQLPEQGTGDWPHPLETHDIDDSGLRRIAGEKNQFATPQGLLFATPGISGKNNILFTSQWDNYPHEKTIALSGNSTHAWFLVAGSTNPMQSQLTNGELVVAYTDGTTATLTLRNPETWWPIEKDYYTDDFAFSLKQPRPPRLHLKTGTIISGDDSKTRYNGKEINGGAATILDLPLDGSKTLKSLTVRTVANDVVVGLMAVTLARE